MTNKTLIVKPLEKTTIEARKNLSDWKNIQFTQEKKKISTFHDKEKLINKIKIKSQLKLKVEIERWSRKKIPGMLEEHLREHTRGLLKK